MGFDLSPADIDRLVRAGVIDPAQLGTARPAVRPTPAPTPARRSPAPCPGGVGAWAARLTLTVPGLGVVSEPNRRDFRLEVWRRGKAQANRLTEALDACPWADLLPRVRAELLAERPVVARWVKLGGKALDDDNRAAAFKAVRDRLAQAVGVDDGNPAWAWRYAWEAAKPCGIRLELELAGDV